VEALDLQRAEQRLGHGIVSAISLAPHRACHFEVRQEFAVIVAGILAAAIRMEDQPWRRILSHG